MPFDAKISCTKVQFCKFYGLKSVFFSVMLSEAKHHTGLVHQLCLCDSSLNGQRDEAHTNPSC